MGLLSKVPLPVKHGTRSGPPEGPAGCVCVHNGIQEDERTHRHLVDTIHPTR